jgi:hypothetical protein
VALETVGQLENLKLLTPEEISTLRKKIAAKFVAPSSELPPLQQFMEWSVSDRRSGTISPFFQVTVSEWLETVAKRIISDSKPDVLYLRGFGTDPPFSATAMGFTSGWLTDEEQLGEVLQPFGDLVAIGKPGETLPTPGAARLYASDAEWKKVVTDQMQTARLVVIRAGTSEGLLWELKQAVQIMNPKKLLILLLKMRKKHYEAFKKEADQIFNATFPKVHELKRFGTISGFVRFSPDWSPNFLPLRAPSLALGYKPYCTLFKFTLRPVFEEYGLEWKPPPRVSKLVLWLGICVLFLFVIFLLAFAMDHLE